MVLLLPLYNKRSDSFIHNLVLLSDEQSLSAINQRLFMITSWIVVSTSKNSNLKINATFNGNSQIFGPYYADRINDPKRKLVPVREGVK